MREKQRASLVYFKGFDFFLFSLVSVCVCVCEQEMHLRRGESKRLLHVFGWRSARHINMCRRACTHNWLHTQKKVKLKMRPSSKGGAARGHTEREPRAHK